MQVDINKYKKGRNWQKKIFKADYKIYGEKLRHDVAKWILRYGLHDRVRDEKFLNWLGYVLIRNKEVLSIQKDDPDWEPNTAGEFNFSYSQFWSLNHKGYDFFYLRKLEKDMAQYFEPNLGVVRGKKIKLELFTQGLILGLKIHQKLRFKSRESEKEFLIVMGEEIHKKDLLSREQFAINLIKNTNTRKRKVDSVLTFYKRL